MVLVLDPSRLSAEVGVAGAAEGTGGIGILRAVLGTNSSCLLTRIRLRRPCR